LANPQKENGYTAIANEILEALINNQFTSQELRVILLIIRKTYGYHKKMDFVSLSQIADAIKSSKTRCSQVVRKLELMKILTVNENINGIGKSYIFNKDFEKWKGVNENIKGISKYKRGVNENIKGGVNENINHKRKNINIQLKKKEYILSGKPDDVIPYKEIIDYLNLKTDSNYRHKTERYRALIQARWNEGHREEDFKYVIKIKSEEWLNDLEFNKFLRPDTLFSNKFGGYRNQKRKEDITKKDDEAIIEEYYRKHPEERYKE